MTVPPGRGTDEEIPPLIQAVQTDNPLLLEDLLKHGESPFELYQGCTALWHATSLAPPQSSSNAKIVELLISYGSDVNFQPEPPFGEGKLTTPLINAILQKNYEAAKVLIDSKADTEAKMEDGRTAVDLVGTMGFMWRMKVEGRRAFAAEAKRVLVVKTLDFVRFVAYLVNEVTQSKIFQRLFGLLGEKPSSLAGQKKPEADPRDIQAFTAEMQSLIKDQQLDKLFGPNDPFLLELVRKASELARLNGSPNPDSLYGNANIKKLTHLSLYQPILFLDNSGSMLQSEAGQRIVAMTEIVKRVARITTMLVPDDSGVHIRFLNDEERLREPQRAVDLEAMAEEIPKAEYKFGTQLGTNIRANVLEPFVYRLSRERTLKRPVLISVITDGEPNYEPENHFKEVIRECKDIMAQNGYDPRFVRFHISQVGNAPGAEKFLDQLRNDEDISGLIYVAKEKLDQKFRELNDNDDQLEVWLLKTLLGPILELNVPETSATEAPSP